MKIFCQNNSFSFLWIGIWIFFAFGAVLHADEGRVLTETRSSDGRIEAKWNVSPVSPRLFDKVELDLTICFDSNLDVTMPEFGEEIGDLKIIDSKENVQYHDSNTEIKSLKLIVVPKTSGTTSIWPITISYRDKRDTLKEKNNAIELPACELEIISTITEENASLDRIPSTKTIIDLTTGWGRLFALFLLLFAIALLAIAKFSKRAKEETKTDNILSAQEIAMKRLVDLHESRLHETDIKGFYTELTGIVRWYIEQQTLIRAPELTTQEFLKEISDQWKNRLSTSLEIRERLQLFLESADMVKFAKMKPSPEDISLAFQRAVEFIKSFLPSRKPGFDENGMIAIDRYHNESHKVDIRHS